ncbi:MAG: transcription termination factor Rho [Clostridia bacterium]|nr:transcription termination factor Rho [Clostridia bacterium]
MRPQDDLNKMSVKELKAIAGAIGIDAASMKKAQIIEALLSAGTPADNKDAAQQDLSPRQGDNKAEKETGGEETVKRGRGRPSSKKSVGKAEPVESKERPREEKGAEATPASVPEPQEEQAEQRPAGDISKTRSRNYTPEQRAAQFKRDVQNDLERKNYSFSFNGGQSPQDKRQNGQRSQAPRQFDQRNNNEKRFAPDRFQNDAKGVQELRNRQNDFKNQNDQNGRRDQANPPRFFAERSGDNADDDRTRYDAQPQNDALAQDTQDGEQRDTRIPEEEKDFDCYGILEINQNGYGFLRAETLYPGPKDIFVPPPLIRRHMLRTGDMITGKARVQSKEYNAQFALISVLEINGIISENVTSRPSFDSLIPTYPDERLVLETTRNEYSTRIIDLFSPIGKGQRGLIVSPPKAGKTVLLKTIANALIKNYPDVHLIMLLIDERPEEVTDIKESVKAMVVASTFDEMTSRHIAVSEFCLEHAERMVEMGEDVVILMDSITRLARAYNQEVTPSGRSLSGGLDPAALYKPKKFFGAARNIKGGGSLTIIATALVDTGSRLDDVIYEEFKGTGNMELHLDRSLAERRIFPSIDITLSGTRKEELLLPGTTLDKIYALRRSFANINNAKDITEAVINNIAKTEDNKQFLNGIKIPGVY